MHKNQIIRKVGDFINNDKFPVAHTEKAHLIANKPWKYSVCRCWKADKFPLCDNAHKALQKQGVNVGPCMVEIRKVGMESVSAAIESAPRTGRFAVAAGLATGIAHLAGFI